MVSNKLIERREAHNPALLTAIRKPLSQDTFACLPAGDRGNAAWTLLLDRTLFSMEPMASAVPANTESSANVTLRVERRLAPVFAGVQGTSVSIARRDVVNTGVTAERETGVFGTRVAAGPIAPAHNYKSIVLAQRDPRGAKGRTGGVPPRRKPDEG